MAAYCTCRKTSNSWTKDTTDFVDDGHAWRKYGQKEILNASHPRYIYMQLCIMKIHEESTAMHTKL